MLLDLDSLNENQHAAVLWNEGPLLVLAGPGSGKTRVLTLRVARLLQESESQSVLALTFTNKAAAEMRERVDRLLGRRGDSAHLCTFHSFATDVLRQHGSHLGVQPDFSLLTLDEDRIAILDEVATELAANGYAIPSDRKNVLELLDRLFSESYEGGPVAPSLVHTPDWVPQLFQAYCDALIATNRLDFGSLLVLTCRLLRDKPGVRRVLRLAWTHVCVDEFQDTNRAQYDLLKLIVADEQPNLFVVADDDQIIYQWNGASPERLQSLQHDFEMEVIQLPENYRCPPEIVALANTLIAHNRFRTPNKKPLSAFRSATVNGDVVRYRIFDNSEDEVRAVAQDIQERQLKSSGVAILARTAKLLEQAAGALRSAGFDAYVARRKNDFYTPVVRVMFHALRSANARHDRNVLRRLCVAWDALTNQLLEVEDVAAAATLTGGDFLRAWSEAAAQVDDEQALALVAQVRSGLVDRLEFPGIVDWFLREGWNPWHEEDDREMQDEIDTWRELHDEIVREHRHDDLTLNVYLQQMDLAPKTSRPGPNAVRCMTVHGSKGLEFNHVYLVGMAQEVFPAFQALRKGKTSREVEEERRNCFVAITRVQDSLTLTRAREYNGWSKVASQFLAEMGLEP